MSTLALASPGRRLYRQALAWYVRLTQRHRYDRLVLERVGDLPLVVLPGVFNPALLRSGELLAGAVGGIVSPGMRFLDLGTGSGASAIAAARDGCHVVAVDINPRAVRCARINALLNECEVDVRQGDLFAPVEDEQFDVIAFNPPFYRGTPRDGLDHAWRSPDLIERFAAGLAAHLLPGGFCLLVLSSDGEHAQFLAQLRANDFDVRAISARDFINERMWVYKVSSRC